MWLVNKMLYAVWCNFVKDPNPIRSVIGLILCVYSIRHELAVEKRCFHSSDGRTALIGLNYF